MTLIGSLIKGDVRKGEYTMSKLLEHHRWFTEYRKAYNTKQFMLNLPTKHTEDLCRYASYDAYLTGSNKMLYLHEYLNMRCGVELRKSISPLTALTRFPIAHRHRSG